LFLIYNRHFRRIISSWKLDPWLGKIPLLLSIERLLLLSQNYKKDNLMNSKPKRAHQKKSSVNGQIIMPIDISGELFTKFKTTKNL
jgi:hypothetical protein